MYIRGIIFFAFLGILFSCSKNNDSYNATVKGKGIDCGNSFLIVLEADAPDLPANNSGNTFYEINLPEEFKIEGKKINIKFREPTNSEIIVCTTLGVGYPQLYITTTE
jgi:hypothetical protein